MNNEFFEYLILISIFLLLSSLRQASIALSNKFPRITTISKDSIFKLAGTLAFTDTDIPLDYNPYP